MTTEQSQVQGDLDAFPSQIRESVDGLAWLGHLEDSFEFCGHHFTLRTLKADEDLAVALLAKEYAETLGQGKAWAWANVALALTAVDHDVDFCPPIGPDRLSHARARFQYVTSRWYWPVGEWLFQRYAQLVERQQRAMEAIQDLSTRSQVSFSPSPDSSIEQGDFESQMEALADEAD